MHRFYAQNIPESGTFALTGPELHHLKDVLRLGPGDDIALFDGTGREFTGILTSVGKKSAAVNITRCEIISREPFIDIHVCSAVPKGGRADFLIEKLSELGVRSFTPILWRRSVVKPTADSQKIEKWRRIAIEASKQSGRTTLTRIIPPMTVSELADVLGRRPQAAPTRMPGSCSYMDVRGGGSNRSLQGEADPWSARLPRGPTPQANTVAPDIALLASPRASVTLENLLARISASKSALCIVGPEGGVTDEEAALLAGGRVEEVRIASPVLRVETAAVAIASFLGAIRIS